MGKVDRGRQTRFVEFVEFMKAEAVRRPWFTVNSSGRRVRGVRRGRSGPRSMVRGRKTRFVEFVEFIGS